MINDSDWFAMTFRVGLLFHSTPKQPFVLGPVADLLQKINVKSAPIRNGQQLTLVPFVRTTDMTVFAQSIADIGYAVEAAAFDEAGVTFGLLAAFVRMQHPTFNDHLDFNLGMRVLLSRCDVIVIICQERSEFWEIRKRLEMHHNTYVLLSLVSTHDVQTSFLDVNPQPAEMDGPSWLLALTERWEAMNGMPQPLPKRKVTILGFIFPLFYSIIIGQRSETIKKKRPTEAERCVKGMGLSAAANKKLESSDRKSSEVFLDATYPFFARHDELGTHYSNVFRTTCFLVPLLIVVSTVLAVAAAIDTIRHDVWHISEAVLLIAAAVLFLRSKIAKHHRKWVENRLLTELLRPALLNEVFHTIPLLAPPPEDPELWIDRSRILLKHLRALPRMVFTTPKDELLSARISAIADFASDQATWHKNFADQHRAAEKRLTRTSVYAFVVTLCLCVLQLIIAYNLEAMTGIAHVLMMLTLISAGGAFVLLLLSHQLGFEAIAERSNNAAEHFESLQQAIKQSGHVADARQVYEWAYECASTILAEQHSWYRQIPLIRMHL